MTNFMETSNQAELVKRYKQTTVKNFDGSTDQANVSSRIAAAYMRGDDPQSIRDLHREAGVDEMLGDDMQENARARVPTKSGGTERSGDSLWNNQGILNAYDTKDAIMRLERHATQTLWNDRAPLIKSHLTDDKKEALWNRIASELPNQKYDTLARLTAQLQRPVRRVLDYLGFSRKAAVVHEVGQGEIPYYDLDPEVFAYEVSPDGAVPVNRAEGTRIIPRKVRIASLVQVSIEEAAIRSYNAMERQKDLAIQDMQRIEDKKFTNALWVGANGTNTPITFGPSMTLPVIEEIAATVDANDLHATRLYINRQELKDIRTNIVNSFDPVTQREVYMTGMLGRIYDYAIYVSPKIVPPGFVFATTDPDYLAYIAIWTNVTAEIANNFAAGEPIYGFFFYELLGFTVVNDAAVAVGRKSGSALPDYFDSNV